MLLRAEFDQHKNERDMIKVKKLMEDAEYQLWSNQHYQPKQCMYYNLLFIKYIITSEAEGRASFR